jgi:hypothetical protein
VQVEVERTQNHALWSRPQSVDVIEKRRFDDVLCVVVAKNKSYLGPHVVKLKSGVTSKYGRLANRVTRRQHVHSLASW